MTRALGPLLRGAGLLLGLGAIGLSVRFASGGAAHEWLAAIGVRHGPAGAALFVALATALVAVGVPRQVAAFTAGYAFGAGAGLGLALLATILSLVLDFTWARLLGRAWARRRLRGRLATMDRFLAENPFTATLTLRLLPLGNNLLLNLLGGLSAVPLLPFLAASAIGYVPQTAIFALLGSGVRVDRFTQLLVAVGLFALSGLAGALLLRRSRAGRALAAAPAADV